VLGLAFQNINPGAGDNQKKDIIKKGYYQKKDIIKKGYYQKKDIIKKG